jgi:hypothetical protein
MLQSISGTPAAVLSLTFELINKIEGEMCTSKPRTVLGLSCFYYQRK